MKTILITTFAIAVMVLAFNTDASAKDDPVFDAIKDKYCENVLKRPAERCKYSEIDDVNSPDQTDGERDVADSGEEGSTSATSATSTTDQQ
ncbi:MAG: hypothetical protein OXF05_05025 [Hyphomicrobiales bacterium]|nr:hypothetical protein [Hyphomicrobiales bacterium]